jgi:hypothetical protein
VAIENAEGCIAGIRSLGEEFGLMGSAVAQKDWGKAERGAFQTNVQWENVRRSCKLDEFVPNVDRAISEIGKRVGMKDTLGYSASAAMFDTELERALENKLIPYLRPAPPQLLYQPQRIAVRVR